jgi:hypothetical protein
MYFRSYLNLNTGMGEEMGTRTFIAALAMGILATTGIVNADTVTATLNSDTNVNDAGAGVNPGTFGMSVNFGATPYSPAWVGQINWNSASLSGSSTGLTSAELGTSFSSYCIEGTQDVVFGNPYTWNVTELLPGSSASNIPNPSSGLSGTQVSQLYALYDTHYGVDTTTAIGTTAFQLSVWEIVSGDTNGLSDPNPFGTGSLTASTGGPTDPFLAAEQTALIDASQWVNDAITGVNSFTANYTLYALTNGSAQDQIIAIPPQPTGGGLPPGPSTPLPAALPAGLSAFGCLGAASFLRRRRQTVIA